MTKVKPGTAASCLTKTTDRVEIHEKGEARHSGKMFDQNDRQSRDPPRNVDSNCLRLEDPNCLRTPSEKGLEEIREKGEAEHRSKLLTRVDDRQSST